jgi:hypothetical protein
MRGKQRFSAPETADASMFDDRKRAHSTNSPQKMYNGR